VHLPSNQMRQARICCVGLLAPPAAMFAGLPPSSPADRRREHRCCLRLRYAASMRKDLQPLSLPHRYPQTVHESTYDRLRLPRFPPASKSTSERCRLQQLPETARRTATLAIAESRRKRVGDIRHDVRRVDWTSATTIPQSPRVRVGLTGLAVPRTVRRSLTATAASCPLRLRCVPCEHRT
jgi:hypothetical protein